MGTKSLVLVFLTLAFIPLGTPAKSQAAEPPVEVQAAAPPTPFERGCAIQGRVLDADGKPVSKAVVTLVDPATNFKPAPVKTDKKGNYKFTDLVQSTYRLQATKGGRESDPVDLTFTEMGVQKHNLQLKAK